MLHIDSGKEEQIILCEKIIINNGQIFPLQHILSTYKLKTKPNPIFSPNIDSAFEH